MAAGIRVDTKVSAVTLFEDRARVTRQGRVELVKGRQRLLVEGVAPILADRTLFVHLDGLEGVQVTDVRITRHPVADEDLPEAREELVRRERSLALERAQWGAATQQLALALAEVEKSMVRSLDELADDVAWGRSLPEGIEAWLDELICRREELAVQHVEREFRQKEMDEALGDLRKRLDETRSPRLSLRLELAIDAWVVIPGEAELTLEYTVPGACWRPHHVAILRDDQVTVRVEASIWQNTGEDWPDTELQLSTERSSSGLVPPSLATDLLRARRTGTAIVVEGREQRIQMTGMGAVASQSDDLPGIDDGGEAMLLRARDRVKIASDGRPYRALVDEFTTSCERQLYCAPELSASVFQKTIQANGSTFPLLAGPVDLIHRGGFVGKSRCLYIAPNERFELGFGIDSELVVSRETRELDTKQPLFGAYAVQTHWVKVEIKNLGASVKRIELVERICVSELEKLVIELEPELTSPKAQADENGFVTWHLEVPPFEQAKVELCYVVKRHPDIVGV